jgi:hypothetical protein
MVGRRSMRRLDRLAGEKVLLVETRVCVRAEARAKAEGVDSASCGAPVWLRWRAKQELRGGEPFDDAHGSTADWTVPE